MNTLREHLFEAGLISGGSDAGTHDIAKTNLKAARVLAEKIFKNKGLDFEKEIPNFDKNYKLAKKAASGGKTVRKDMPVITVKDVKDLQRRLSKGFIDIFKPFSKDRKSNDPFPTGLSGKKAKDWLQNGLEVHDGDKNDDKVSVKLGKVEVGKLHPIQKQIYIDKSFTPIAKNGAATSLKFFQSKSSIFIVSKDNFIIDGHHRFLSTTLLNPKMKVNALIIDLPINKLLPLSLSYSDAIGNKRNA